MLQYSTESDSFVPDLVSCNIDNLLKIECVLDTNLSWSDGSSITPEDIKATLNIISQTKVNPIIASLLENTIIETTKDSISFSNTSKDINFLHVFLQPIIPESVVNTLDTENIDGKFSEIGGIYSGRFVLKSISQDETVGITKITL
jgi:ABC-type transport system substrate-binding protein